MTTVDETAQPRRSRQSIPTAAIGLLGLGIGACSVPAASESFELHRVERPAFTMDMPSWDVERDLDQGGAGRYTIVEDALRADVQWSLDGGAGIDVLDTALDVMLRTPDMELIERRVEELPGALRLRGRLLLGGRIWISLAHTACRESDVLVTVSVSGRPREAVESLHSRMLATLQCRSGELPRLTVAWPFTDLPEAFGLHVDGSPVLAHRDGRVALLGRLGSDTIDAMVGSQERADAVMRSYGAGFGIDWTASGRPTETRNLTDTAWLWRLTSPAGDPFAASVFTCPVAGGSVGYIVFTADDDGGSDASQLEALNLRFGCPSEGSPPLLERPSVCDAGVHDLCAESQSSR